MIETVIVTQSLETHIHIDLMHNCISMTAIMQWILSFGTLAFGKIVSEREYGLIMPTIDLHCAIPYSIVVWFKS